MANIPTDNMPQILQPAAMLQAIYNYAFRLFRIGRGAADVLNVPSGVISGTPAASTKIAVDAFDELAVDVTVTAVTGTAPTYSLAIDRLGADGNWYPIYTGANLTAAGVQSISLGVGASTNVAFGKAIRIREIIGGTVGPTITRSVSIVGK